MAQTLGELKPDYPAPYLDLAQGQLQAGQIQQAIATAKGLIQAHPELHTAHTLHGLANLSAGNLNPAISSLRQSLRLQPDPETHFNLGLAYKYAGQSTLALEQTLKAIELRPTMAAAWKLRAQLHAEENDETQALEALREALSLEPNDIDSYTTMTTLLQRSGNFREALRYRELGQRLAKNRG